MTSDLTELYAALAELQANLPEVAKGRTAEVQTKTGGTYKYDYADLTDVSEAILPRLSKLGLAFTSRPTFRDGRFVLAYELIHRSGGALPGEWPITGSTPQAIGSSITYGRRYCLCAVTGLAPKGDDDDAAEHAQTTARAGTAQRAARPAPARQAQRAAPPLPDEMSASMRAKIMALFGKVNITDRGERLATASAIVGRELASANDMTAAEARKLIGELEAAADQAAYLAEVTVTPPADTPTEGGAA